MFTLHNGDCLEYMKTLAPASVDCVITDPPYILNNGNGSGGFLKKTSITHRLNFIEKGFDSKMGARPLQRIIDKEIKRDLAKMMLFGDLKKGGWLHITVENNELSLLAKPKASKVALLTAESV